MFEIAANHLLMGMGIVLFSAVAAVTFGSAIRAALKNKKKDSSRDSRQ